MGDHRKLVAWQKAHAVVLAVYRDTSVWPHEERYGLISQTRRAAVSIAANLAEGCGRDSNAELARYATIAKGEAAELSYFIQLATELGFRAQGREDDLPRAIDELQRVLWSLERSRRAQRQSRAAATVPT